ncbi:MAG: ATP phosphoribosyltransferase [Bacteroidia bacterium]|jgi:ATP phosphoribosyltransferase|nr:ATP phosphoribosyltransferase [Bacteroidia bacterium]
MSAKLRIAIQKSGRLNDDSIRLLRECGIEINNGQQKLKAEAYNFPLEVFFLRDDDIPQYVEDGVADIGIVGENVLLEKGRKAKMIERLGFGKCRLSLAIPRNEKYKSVQDLNGKRIATSYPNLLKRYLKKQHITAEIHEISGSVEIAPGIGLADAICDLVSSGSTLLTNGLREVETVLQSEAVLVANHNLNNEQQRILERLIFRLHAVRKARHNKYILLNAPDKQLPEIISLIPGMKSPTILPLAQKGWSSVHSVIQEDEFWDIIERLKAAGAEGILVVPIEKMIL